MLALIYLIIIITKIVKSSLLFSAKKGYWAADVAGEEVAKLLSCSVSIVPITNAKLQTGIHSCIPVGNLGAHLANATDDEHNTTKRGPAEAPCYSRPIPAGSGGAASPTAAPMPLMMRLFVNELMQNLSMSSAEIRWKKAAHCTHNDRLPACP